MRLGVHSVSLVFCLAGSCLLHGQVNLSVKNPKPSVIDFGYCFESGQVESWEAGIGENVKKGQLIVKFDHARQLHAYETAKLKANSDAQIESVLGELKQKEAQLADSQIRFRRRQITEEQMRMSEGEAEITRGKLKQARLNKQLAALDLELAEKMLEMRYIRSPINGTVMKIERRPGQRAAAGDVVVTVADLSNVEAEVPLSGHILGRLKEGDSIPIRLAGGEFTRLAQVVAVNPLAGAKNGEKMVKIAFANSSPETALASQSYELLMPEGTKLAPVTKAAPPPPKADGKKS